MNAMLAAVPHYREIGSGPTVVCLHSSASSSLQWCQLGQELSDRFRVVAVDLYGYGESPRWNGDRAHNLDDEVALIEPLLRRAGEPVHLVGHSYGGAVALRVALRHPEQVCSLTVYEPVAFSLLREAGVEHAAAREVCALRNAIDAQLAQGNPEAAARGFVDYWSGAGSFDQLTSERRARIAVVMHKVRQDFDALYGDSVPLAAYRQIQVPVLYLHGAASPRSTRHIAALLGLGMRQADVRILDGVGHMGPVTQPERVNELIEYFLEMIEGAAESGDVVAESQVA